jgi:hypothetical protein
LRYSFSLSEAEVELSDESSSDIDELLGTEDSEEVGGLLLLLMVALNHPPSGSSCVEREWIALIAANISSYSDLALL